MPDIIVQKGEIPNTSDSKNPDGPKLTFTPAEWKAFLGGVRSGEFDSLG
ncbi:DUF397 domain-containing protein [Nonomuraea sp. C10]|nr:DUF397 domain-containing protein [Nonomuraea sp. C10]